MCVPIPYRQHCHIRGGVQREEEGESAEVHISLGIEFTCLHVGAVSFTKRSVPGLSIFRYAPDAVAGINKQEKDKDKCDFETVLDFSDLSSAHGETDNIPRGM